MELTDLRTFIHVVEKGGITRAAECLNRVPSSVTTRILHLEDFLGVKLFLREGKRLLITAEGQTLYTYAQRIVELVREAEVRVKSTEPGGKFRIGAMESTAAGRLPKPLAELYSKYPQLELELSTGTSRFLYERLLANTLDAVLIADAPHDARLERTGVFTEELVIIAPEGHPTIHQPGDIQKRTVLAFKEGCSYRNRLIEWFGVHGMEPERVVEPASYHAILGGVAAGMGIGIIPVQVLKLFPDAHTLTVHELPHRFRSAVTELIWRKGMRSANIRVLQSYLRHSE